MSEKSANSRIAVRIAVVAIVVAAAAAALLYGLRPVAVVEAVVTGQALDAKPGSIEVEPEYSMELKSVIGGRVLKQDYALDPGKAVRSGDVLAQLDTTDLDIEIEKAANDLDAVQKRIDIGSVSRFDLENAKSDYENAAHLNKMGGMSDSDLAKSKRQVEVLEQKIELENLANNQELATDANILKEKRHAKDEMTIRAPFDGVVSVVDVHPGDLVSLGASIATLITTNRTVEAKISEEDFADIKPGEEASVIFLPYGDAIFKATVTKILPTADPDTQRHIAFLDVKIPPEKLVPGITGEVSIVVGRRQAPAIIPRRALFAGNRVFVVEDGRVRAREIRKGYVWQTGVEVLEGVSPGDKVIVEDLDKFYDGDHVRLREVPVDSGL